MPQLSNAYEMHDKSTKQTPVAKNSPVGSSTKATVTTIATATHTVHVVVVVESRVIYPGSGNISVTAPRHAMSLSLVLRAKYCEMTRN